MDASAAQFAGVLVGFHGCPQRFRTAGDDELDHARVDVKGGRTFDGVKGGDASAGAGADVDKASALRKGRRDQVDRLRDLPERALHSAGDLGVFTVDDAGDFECRLLIEIGRGGVCFLGAEAAQIRGHCFADQGFRFRRFAFQAIFPKQTVV